MPNSWPSIAAPDFPMDEERDFPVVRTQFETGAVQTRVRFSTKRLVVTLNWNAMSEANYQTLEAFFDANQAQTITWTHPITSVSYTMRIRGDSLKSVAHCNGRRRVGPITLEEA